MWGIENLSTLDGTVAVPVWVGGLIIVLSLVLLALTLIRTQSLWTLSFVAVIGFGVWAAWNWSRYELAEQRRGFEQRVATLDAQVLAGGSPLACLDAALGESVEAACERALFAAPETLAASATLIAARLALLGEGLSFAGRRDASFESALDRLRTALEMDRYGFVAHVLAVRDGCTAERCDTFQLFRDHTNIQTNLLERTFDAAVVRNASSWPGRTARTSTPMSSNFSFPSAASIPPVSIMTSEPTTTGATPPAPAPPAPSEAVLAPPNGVVPPTPPRRPRPQALSPPLSVTPRP